MNPGTEIYRQHQAHKAARRRIYGAGIREVIVKPVVPVDPEPEEKPKLSPSLIWVRQHNEHVIAYLQWQIAVESGRQYTPREERPEVNDIVMEVLSFFPHVSFEEIKGPRREKRLIRPRQLAMYEIYRQRPDLSYPQIGKIFGGRDHTTIMHAVRKISAEPAFKQKEAERV